MIVIVMGVSGAGKTTVGAALAEALGSVFLDADDFHPPQNVAKMASGTPLTDDDRWPWLDRLNGELLKHEAKTGDAVLACSALKAVYRSRLTEGLTQAKMVYLSASFEAIAERVATRKHKYMPASLLESQFRTLEPPSGALEIDATLPVDEGVGRMVAGLQVIVR